MKLSVTDTGSGIREEDRKKLFTDFQRLDAKKNKHIEGTGLGLAITYRLIKTMNGWITVAGVYGEGSTFSVTLPQKVIGKSFVGEFNTEMIAAQEKYQPTFVAPEARIPVVDDNEMNLFVVQGLLKETLVQIDTATSGTEALKLANAVNRAREMFLHASFVDCLSKPVEPRSLKKILLRYLPP